MDATERQKRVRRNDDILAVWFTVGIIAIIIIALLSQPAPPTPPPREAFRVGVETETSGEEWLDCRWDRELDAYYCRRDNR